MREEEEKGGVKGDVVRRVEWDEGGWY